MRKRQRKKNAKKNLLLPKEEKLKSIEVQVHQRVISQSPPNEIKENIQSKPTRRRNSIIRL